MGAQLQMLEDEDWKRREVEKESLIGEHVLKTIFRTTNRTLVIFAAFGSICSESCCAVAVMSHHIPSFLHSSFRSSWEHCRDRLMSFALPVGLDESLVVFR